MNARQPRLAWILVAYLLLALGYGAVNPLFEAPDEHYHFFTARYVARTGRLPAVPPGPNVDPLIGQEAAQPPLYYALSALILAPIDTEAATAELWLNPRVQLGDASAATNRNRAVHTPAEAWPWRGWALGAHLLRAFSAVFGLGTLWCLHQSGRLLWPERPGRALLATGLVAFLPQFVFHHGAISNDPLIIFLASAGIVQLLRLWTGPVTTGRLLALGLTIGGAILTKAAGLLLLGYALLFLAALAWRRRDPGLGVRAIALAGGAALTVSAWLLWRHWILYGDITAANQFVRLAGGEAPLTLWEALGQLWAVRASLVAVFGWFNVRGPDWMYAVWGGIALLGLAGLVRARWRGRGGAGAIGLLPWLLAAWPALVAAGMLAFMMRTPAAQGRLLFPALVPLALGLAAGLDAWPRPARGAALGLALATAITGLAWVIPRAYARPPVIAENAIPAIAARLDAAMGHNLTLLAAQAETQRIEPGDWVWLTLYWRAEASVPQEPAPADAMGGRAPEEVILLLGQGDAPIGKLQTYHGGGLYPATLWPVGGVVVDRVAVRLGAERITFVPVAAVPLVSLVGGRQPEEAPSVTLPAVPVLPARWPAPVAAPLAALGPAIALGEAAVMPQAAAAGDTVVVTARWQVSGPVGRDYTTFVHLGPPSDLPLATGDSPPRGGSFPTRFWDAGMVIDDSYGLTIPPDLPPGHYPVSLGLYDPITGERLPLTANGARQPLDSLVVGEVEVR